MDSLQDVMDKAKGPIQDLADLLRTDVCCLLVYSEGDTVIESFRSNRATGLHDTSSKASIKSSLTFGSSFTNRSSPMQQDMKDSSTSAGQLIFGMGSLSKPIIALQIGMIIDNPEMQKQLPCQVNWNSGAYGLLNKLRNHRGEIENITPLDTDPTIRALVLHQAFPPMTSFLFGYDGKFISSAFDFLQNGARVAQEIINREIGDNGRRAYQYSNCNYLLLLLLIAEINHARSAASVSGRSAIDMLKECILEPLGMRNTFFDRAGLQIAKKELIQQGWETTADLSTSYPVDEKCQYLDDEISGVLFGGRTCVEDYAKLIKAMMTQIVPAEAKESPDKTKSSLFTLDVMLTFFKIYTKEDTESMSHIGRRGRLNGEMVGSESLNQCVRERVSKPYTLGQKKESQDLKESKSIFRKWKNVSAGPLVSRITYYVQRWMLMISQNASTASDPRPHRTKVYPIMMHYKGGLAPGYTASLYASAEYSTFAIAFTNTQGPLDEGDLACQHVLQELFNLDPRVDINKEIQGNLLPKATELLEAVSMKPEPFTIDDRGRLLRWVGRYKRYRSGREVRITPDGEFIVNADHGPQSVVQCRSFQNHLRLYPTALDRRTVWQDVRFQLLEHSRSIQVIEGDYSEIYERMNC